jgi:serine/threonine-protein kinase ULK/ATG1
MIENYSLHNEIGRGMYSTVFRAVNMKTKQEVAIKQVRAEKFKQFPKLEEGTYNEINILSNLESCPHIIKYFDMLKTVNNFYFVYEYCNGGTLEKLLKEKGSLSERQAIAYFAQIVEAFRVLNKNNIMHRDLKPENLLLHDGIIKLADFGFCKPLENEDEISKTMLGSPIYMAPEILKGESYSIKSDIWSLGVVLFRMLYGYCPFESNNIGKLIMAIDQEDLKIPEKPYVSPEVLKLMRRMITKNPNMRA